MEPFKKFSLLKETQTITTCDTVALSERGCLHCGLIIPLNQNDMSKKLTQTFEGNKEKQLETILKILWVIRNDSEFYFFAYGKDIIARYLEDHQKDNRELIKHLQSLVENKNAFIEAQENKTF